MKKAFQVGFVAGLVCTFGLFFWFAAKTTFTTGTTVTSDFMNSIYQTDGGHIHDGSDAGDGHAPLIDCPDHIDWETDCVPASATSCSNLNFDTPDCENVFCGSFDWTDSDCDNKVDWSAQAFASTHYDFLPLHGFNFGTTGGADYYEHGTDTDFYTYAKIPSSGEGTYAYFYFITAWRPPVDSSTDDEEIRFVYYTYGDDCGEGDYTLTLRLEDVEYSDDSVSWSTEESDLALVADTSEVFSTAWNAFTQAAAEDDDGVVMIEGYVKATGYNIAGGAQYCYLRPIGLEIKYTGTKN